MLVVVFLFFILFLFSDLFIGRGLGWGCKGLGIGYEEHSYVSITPTQDHML